MGTTIGDLGGEIAVGVGIRFGRGFISLVEPCNLRTYVDVLSYK